MQTAMNNHDIYFETLYFKLKNIFEFKEEV